MIVEPVDSAEGLFLPVPEDVRARLVLEAGAMFDLEIDPDGALVLTRATPPGDRDVTGDRARET